MMQDQQESASELGGLKESLAAEVSIHGSSNITPGNRSANMRLPACLPCLSAVQLQELQDEAWKLQMFSELEMLKRQLANQAHRFDGTVPGNGSGNRDGKAKPYELSRHFHGTGEGVHYPPHLVGTLFAHNPQNSLKSPPTMNQHRQTQVDGNPELLAKRPFLQIQRHLIGRIEAGFTDGNSMLRTFPQLAKNLFIQTRRMHRMNAVRRHDLAVSRSQH